MFKYECKCKKCGKPMTIVNVYFTTSTLIVIETLCIHCNSITEDELDFLNIQANIRNSKNCMVYEGNATVQ